MKFFDMVGIAFLNLWRRKLRTILTVLGMAIGTTSIVTMVSLGIGINQSYMDSFENAGSLTTITVSRYNWNAVPTESGGKDGGYSEPQEMTLDDRAVDMFRAMEGVEVVMPRLETWGYLKWGKYMSNVSILAVDPAVAEQFGFTLAEGRLPEGNTGANYEITFGAWTLREFYDPKSGNQATDANGESLIDIDSPRFQLTFDPSNVYPDWYVEPGSTTTQGSLYRISPVGVMSEEGNEYSWYSIMSIDDVLKLARKNKTFINLDTENYSNVLVKCVDADAVSKVTKELQAMGYGTYSLQEALEMAQQTTAQLRLLLGAIGGVALLVAAIGITNTMMMSIYERTREIGIMKVVGCRMGNIAELFLSEAAMIGLLGGAVGLGTSYVLALIINKVAAESGFMSVIPAYLAVGAVAFSMVVALVSGLYPSIRAMRLSPLSAMRNE